MRRWTRPSRPRRAAGKERVAGGLLGLRGYRRGGTGHTPRTAKQTVPAWSLGPYAWPLPSWVVRIRATLTVRFTMSVNYPARWDISYRYMGQPGRVIGRFAGPARIRDQARSATLEVERVSRPGRLNPGTTRRAFRKSFRHVRSITAVRIWPRYGSRSRPGAPYRVSLPVEPGQTGWPPGEKRPAGWSPFVGIARIRSLGVAVQPHSCLASQPSHRDSGYPAVCAGQDKSSCA